MGPYMEKLAINKTRYILSLLENLEMFPLNRLLSAEKCLELHTNSTKQITLMLKHRFSPYIWSRMKRF